MRPLLREYLRCTQELQPTSCGTTAIPAQNEHTFQRPPNRIMTHRTFILITILGAPVAGSAQEFVDWQTLSDITPGGLKEIANGTLFGTSVTLNCAQIYGLFDSGTDWADTNIFQPPLPVGDSLWIQSTLFTLDFGRDVANPIFYFGDLRGPLTFSNSIIPLAGDTNFSVVGNTISTSSEGFEAYGSIMVPGTFRTIQFAGDAGDTLIFQVGAYVVPEVGSLWSMCLLVASIFLSRTKVFRRGARHNGESAGS